MDLSTGPRYDHSGGATRRPEVGFGAQNKTEPDIISDSQTDLNLIFQYLNLAPIKDELYSKRFYIALNL